MAVSKIFVRLLVLVCQVVSRVMKGSDTGHVDTTLLSFVIKSSSVFSISFHPVRLLVAR